MPASLSVGLPLFVFLGPAILTLLIPDQEFVEIWIESERGLVENLTTVLAIIGVVVALVAVRRSAQLPNRLLTVWLVLFALGFLYIATEETSLGQHWIPWKTPDWLADVNRYGEANLHNVSTTIDRIPKTIVGLVVVLAGVGWPLYRRWRGIVLGGATDWRRWFLPTDGTLLLLLPSRAQGAADGDLPVPLYGQHHAALAYTATYCWLGAAEPRRLAGRRKTINQSIGLSAPSAASGATIISDTSARRRAGRCSRDRRRHRTYRRRRRYACLWC
jgi:hypothetical protein